MKRLWSLISMIFLVVFVSNMAFGQEAAFTKSTFHCISVYWTPSGGDSTKKVLLEYRKSGETQWRQGLDMKYNPIAGCGNNPVTGKRYDKADYRGSLVNLKPDTEYDIHLTLEGTATDTIIQATTWSETFPISQTIKPGNLTTKYVVPSSGTAQGYLLIDGTGDTIDIQDGSFSCIDIKNKEYVIIRGYTLKNAARYGIFFENCEHIVIEGCDISGWGEEDENGFGKNYQSAIHGGYNDAVSGVFQRNKIHDPRWDTNSWAELHNGSYHPSGPQGISLGNCYIGNNVFRYNEIWSDSAHYFNDIMGMWSNASYAGFPGADSDIYGNYLANCWDDGIESEGGNINVRIWNNYIEEVYLGIGNAPTSIGPLYVWRNVFGRSYSPPGSQYGEYAAFIKMGYASSIDWMTGHMYLFHNTVLQPGGEGMGGVGTSDNDNRYVKHCETLNNIIHVRDTTTNAISIRTGNTDFSYDYDLTNKPYPTGQEVHGLSGTPVYESGAPSFDFGTKTGNFKLSTSSPGYDAGDEIPNFTGTFLGTAPDMGAHENGTADMVYGTRAVFSPTGTGNVGIGQDDPKAKLQIKSGDIYLETLNTGVIMKSPDGKCWKLTVDNMGNIITTQVTCP